MRSLLGLVFGLGALAALGAGHFLSSYPDVGPPPDLKIEATAERVARGRYLANHVSVCVDCHSERDWRYFSGPVAHGTEGKGGERFGEEAGLPGTFFARNITPAGIGEWTDGELARAITTGVTADGEALFPIMPYPAYASLSDEDLESLIAYVRTLTPLPHAVPERELSFPMNFIVRTIPRPREPRPPVDHSDPVAYGRYLVGIAACGECHTMAVQGEKVAGMEFAGGFEFAMPGGIVRSANITPDPETGLGNWSEDGFVDRFKTFAGEAARIPIEQGTVNTPMPWTMYAGMEEQDLRAIYRYLQTVTPVEHRVERFPYPEDAAPQVASEDTPPVG